MSQSRIRAGRVVIVTGAGRGIGRAIALALAAESASVVAVSRTLPQVEETAALVKAAGGKCLPIAVDVSDWESVQAMVSGTIQTLGTVHALVNNAGVQAPIGPLVTNDAVAWAQTIQINLVGTFHCCKAVLPHMIEQRYGRIVNLSGGGATGPRPNFSAYAASKAAVVRLTETLAEEVGHLGIQVNAIAPGAVNTAMLDQVLRAGDAAGEDALAVAHRQLESGGTSPTLAAALTLCLASDEWPGLSGKLISAPNDDWQSWDSDRIGELMDTPWLTLRRLDPFTVNRLVAKS